MTERLSFTKKLILMLIVPIAGLLVFAALQTSEKLQVVSSMRRLDEITVLGAAGTHLVHELQKERGRTAGYISSGRKQAAELQAQQARSDEALASFRSKAQSLELEGDLKRKVDQALQKLTELPNQRSMVTAGSISLAASIEWYTETIGSVLDIVSAIGNEATDANTGLRLLSLEALLRDEEAAGQERALLNAVFSSGKASDKDRRQLADLVGRQAAYAQMFMLHASSEAAQTYRQKMTGSYVDEVKRFRSLVIDPNAAPSPAPASAAARAGDLPKAAAKAGNGSAKSKSGHGKAARAEAVVAKPSASDGHLDVSPQDWWRASTARIDALASVGDVAERGARGQVDRLQSHASWALVFFAILAVLSILGAVVMSYVLARGMIRSFTGASDTLSRIVSQIGGFVQQQSSSTSQTASSVSETTTTVEEIRKTAETADSSSKQMSEVAQQSRATSDDALQAVAHGAQAMQHIRSEVEGIAQNILELSEKNMQIGEIVQSVNAIAEQSNLLAVNASIEAAKAGDHGKGFSVVASEVKALAQQSKEATDQIRSILGEIQKSSNAAVMITEQGVKRVEEGGALIEELGRTIQNLAGAIQQNSDSATQISLISTQQLAGIGQITEAMRNIGAATSQNADGARQLEEAATEVRSVSTKILEIVQGQQGSPASRTAA